MDTKYIEKQIEVLNQGIAWGKQFIKEEAEGQEFHRRLVNIRREMSKIQFAMSERCAAATFGESQMGKSYLVNAMFSDPSTPFSVSNGGKNYVFKRDINPSEENSQIEATGVVTRFTHRQVQMPKGVPDGFLCAQMLSVADIILILSEAYYNEVDYKIRDTKEWTDDLKEKMQSIKIGGSQNLLSEDDILNIEEYYTKTQLAKKCGPILSGDVRYFPFLLQNIMHLSEPELIRLVKLLWCENENISKLFEKLIEHYRQLDFSSTVYVDFEAILKKHGTLVDVSRLDEMFIDQPDVCPPEYKRTTHVYVPNRSNALDCEKSFLSALTAELTMNIVLPENQDKPRDFFENLDILDFPGACPDEQFKESELYEPKKLTRVYRRGKVSYLFKKYSTSRRISTLLFCHNNHQSKYGLMGRELREWIEKNIGETTQKRDEYIRRIGISPFFIISTWFNTDLEYANKKEGDDLNYLWQRRFNAVLSTDVLKYGTVEEHWFDHWTNAEPNFRNIYMLRDFDHSKMIFRGYDPDAKKPEEGVLEENYVKYPAFLSDLKRTFETNEFVRKHFVNPSRAWEESATPTHDGTKPVMEALNALAPNIAGAREVYFTNEMDKLHKEFLTVLENLYESGDASESIKKAKRTAGRINLSIDSQCGEDPYFFGRMMDSITIPEATFYEMVFARLDGHQQALPMTDRESQIYMNAKLDSGLTRSQNVERLCDYLGLDSEHECAEVLKEQGVDVESLLNKTQMLVNSAEQLVNYIEEYWYNTFLMGARVNMLKEKLPLIGDVFQNMFSLYKELKVHQLIVQRVDKYIKEIKEEVQPRIIADYLAMEYNHFTMCYGYDYIQPEALKKLEDQSAENNLNIDWELLHHQKAPSGIALLENMAKTMDKLANMSYGAEVHSLQLSLPEYKSRWQWEQQMRVAMLMVCNIPNPKYGVPANDKLGEIIKNVKS